MMTKKEQLELVLDLAQDLMQSEVSIQHVETKDFYSGAIVSVDFVEYDVFMLVQVEDNSIDRLRISFLQQTVQEASDAAYIGAALAEASSATDIAVVFTDDTIMFDLGE